MRSCPLIVASISALLTFAATSVSAQTQGGAQGDNGQSIPDAPQPQKKPAPKPPPPPDSADSHPTPPADDSAPKQPPAKDDNAFPEAVSRKAAQAASDAAKPPAGDDNAFPEAVSRDAAKAASDAAGKPASDAAGKPASDATGTAKHPAADDNPFPEAVSREAAKAAGNDQASPAPKPDLPPGVSSSQSSDDFGDAENPTGRRQLPNPGRAKKDAEVGGFYLNQGNYQGALERYQDAMAIDPTNVDVIFGLAQSQQMLKKNADAARNYQLYLDIVPNGPKAKQALKALKTLQPGN
jgi:tetratricopeptide (TPR) repeat protein